MNNKNIFTRILIVILSLFLATLIIISFLLSEQKFVITGGIIICTALLIILVLSEMFDSFSIGNLISLKKKLKETDQDLERSKKENETLRNQLIAQINFITKQSNTQNIILSSDYEKLLGVEKASDIDEKNKSEQKDEDAIEAERDLSNDLHNRRLFFRNFEKYAYDKVVNELNIDKNKIFKDMQFKEGMIGFDPIMEKNIRFDGYFVQNDCECFLEIKSQFTAYSPSIFMIYYILNKIYFYKKATGKNAKLILIVPILEHDLVKYRRNTEADFEIVRQTFMPAINNNLLEIKPINIDKLTYEKIISMSDVE